MTVKTLRFNVSSLMLIFFTALGLFSGYSERTTLWQLSAFGVFFAAIISSEPSRQGLLKNRRFLSLFGIILLMILGNVFIKGYNGYAQKNLIELFYSLIVALSIYASVQNENNVMKYYLDVFWVILNIFWLVNLVVLSVQVTGNPLLIKQKWLETNPFYPDLCAGFFGYNRTHQMCFFSTFMIVYDLYVAERFFSKRKSSYRTMLIYTYGTAVWMLILSTMNDNTAYFVMLPVSILLFYYYRNRSVSAKSRFIKFLKYAIPVIALVFILFQTDLLGGFINDTLTKRFSQLFDFDQNNAHGSNERLAIAQVALTNSDCWFLGRGLLNNAWISVDALGFVHYGLSSIGSFIDLMGIWFYILYTALFSVIMMISANRYKKENVIMEFLISFVVMLMVSIYTNIYTSEVTVFWLLMTFAVYGELNHKTAPEKKPVINSLRRDGIEDKILQQK